MSQTPSPQARAQQEASVIAMFAAAGLSVTPGELEGFVEAYGPLKAGIESLYAIPECRYESPALIFTATPVFADWS